MEHRCVNPCHAMLCCAPRSGPYQLGDAILEAPVKKVLPEHRGGAGVGEDQGIAQHDAVSREGPELLRAACRRGMGE